MRLPHAVDGRETFVLPAQLSDDLGVATPDDPPEPCSVFGRQRATSSMEFSHFEEVPANLAKEIIEKSGHKNKDIE